MGARSSWRKALGGAVIAVAAVAGCRQIAGLDSIEYADAICAVDAECDDGNPCTEDTCGAEAECVHVAGADGLVPDGVQGNCKLVSCEAGQPSDVFFADDVDDGNGCTEDACSQAGGVITATHEDLPSGVACDFQGGLGVCDGAGSCAAQCGFAGEDGAEVGCPAAPNPCTLSFCDKAKGVCVTEKLDGIPAPGSPEPGECGGAYCVGGEVSEAPVPMGTPCIQTGGDGAGLPGVCSAGGKCTGCNTKLDCQDAIPESECHQWVCMGGTCQNTTEPDGPLASQVIGDCHVKTCNGGNFVEQVDDADVMDDGNDCTSDTCSNGAPLHVDEPTNTPCGTGGLLYCQGGVCKGCTQDEQCGSGTECKTPKCDGATGQCYFQNEPPGKVVSVQTTGDCANNVCDANGEVTTAYNAADPQNDGLDCTVDTCVAMNQTSHTPQAYGTTCDDAGGIVCDAAAHCVGKPCGAPADCPGGTFCVDGVCCDAACGGACQACSAGKKGAGKNGLCGAILAGDPDSECPGGSNCSSGACQPLPDGAACVNIAGECASGFCADGFCCNAACNGTCVTCSALPGICSPIASGQDPASECPNGACDGAGACRKDDGQPCTSAGDCLSGLCADDVCCNTTCGATCQACNVSGSVGTCTNVPNNQDPASECPNGACNGGGQCKLDNGQPCGGNGDCLSGQCADGVCCNTTCTGTCKACNVSGSVGTCTNVPGGQDPGNDCAGSQVCDGAGGCKKAQGDTCVADAECLTGQCADGVCCDTACTGTCKACVASKTPSPSGVCDTVDANTDPDSECSGARVCGLMGTCVGGPDGAFCAAGSECASGFCVDSVCCDSACTGTCKACTAFKKGSGINGVCGFIDAGQDPDSECTGATPTCDGAGNCGP